MKKGDIVRFRDNEGYGYLTGSIAIVIFVDGDFVTVRHSWCSNAHLLETFYTWRLEVVSR